MTRYYEASENLMFVKVLVRLPQDIHKKLVKITKNKEKSMNDQIIDFINVGVTKDINCV